MTPPESEYQRFYIPKAIQRILGKNPNNIIPITKEAKENRLWRIAEGASKRNSQIGQGGSQEASGAGSAEGSKGCRVS